jgi:antitoxin (DNA-binding transcriptional repressor) of toxin-antitoxin stability system
MVMKEVNIADLKARLAEYLDLALAGESIVICRHNKPIAEIRRLEGARGEPRPVGPLAGRPAFTVPDAFFEPLPADDLAAWEGVDAERGAAKRPAPRVTDARAAYGARPPRRSRRS